MTENTFDPKAFVEQLLAQPGSQPDERAVIESRKSALRADNAARDELAAETAPAIPAAYPGNEFLTQPDESPAWRIASLWPAGGNVVLAAQFKAGKTTLRDNLIKAWCDGEAFLGAYVITPPVCPLFVIDAEMAPTMARRWLKAHSIEHPERFTYANIRGGAAAFNPLASALRAQWAKRITGSAAVLLDCLGPVMGALGLDENKAADIGRFLASFEQLLAEAGVSESFVIHHMGHAAERSRGASRLRDWPDAEWRLVRQDDDPASDRYLSAFGRDVEVPESRLGFDPETRRLTLDGGSRQDTRVAGARAAVIELLTGQPGLSTNAISDQLSEEHGRNAVRAALAALVKDREVTIQKGPRRSKPHSLTAPVGQCATTTPPA